MLAWTSTLTTSSLGRGSAKNRPACDPVRPRIAAMGQRSRSKKPPICSGFFKPSGGLEPPTPSLPWRFRGGSDGHGRALAATFHLQIAASCCSWRAGVCPRVHRLSYPSRTRGVLSLQNKQQRRGAVQARPRWRMRASFRRRLPIRPGQVSELRARPRAGAKRSKVIGGDTLRAS
jgi:hypothetical protein